MSWTQSGQFDVILLDTPPSRNALDFLDAPQRLTGFLQGRALKILTAPTGAAAKIAARGSGLVFHALRHVTGVDLLSDLSAFFGVLSTVTDGFAERAGAVGRLLADPATTFLIVSSPEPAPVEEAIFFRRRLGEAGLPFGGLIVNRVRVLVRSRPEIDEAALAAELGGDAPLAARSAATLRDLHALARRDAARLARLEAELDDRHPIIVPQLDRGVSDVAGLVAVQCFLFAASRQRSTLLRECAF